MTVSRHRALLDMDSGRPIEMLADRESVTVAAWLATRPGVEVICRDRAGAYAEAATLAAPNAVQVADRWHLWHNLAGHLDRVVAAHRRCLNDLPDPDPVPVQEEAVPDPLGPGADAAAEAGEGADDSTELWIIRRTRERHREVAVRRADGMGIAAIARELGLDRRTVRRYARADDVESLQVKNRQRSKLIDDYTDHLHRRWNEGATNAVALAAEIAALGYRGSPRAVRTYLHPLRTGQSPPRSRPAPPTARQVTSWMLRHPDSLTADEQVRFKQVRAQCPELDTAAGHVAAFAQMMTGRHGDRLDTWLDNVDTTVEVAGSDAGLAPLRTFANGLRRDYDAVRAGLTLPHSSGRVEGTVNKIKMIKRQMYGRANFDLLRTRILHAH